MTTGDSLGESAAASVTHGCVLRQDSDHAWAGGPVGRWAGGPVGRWGCVVVRGGGVDSNVQEEA
ncbi:hypothetical protein FAIPA1_360015 [Frankia sp. AiPs1]